MSLSVGARRRWLAVSMTKHSATVTRPHNSRFLLLRSVARRSNLTGNSLNAMRHYSTVRSRRPLCVRACVQTLWCCVQTSCCSVSNCRADLMSRRCCSVCVCLCKCNWTTRHDTTHDVVQCDMTVGNRAACGRDENQRRRDLRRGPVGRSGLAPTRTGRLRGGVDARGRPRAANPELSTTARAGETWCSSCVQ